MWVLRRSVAVSVGCVALANLVLAQAPPPNATPPAAEPPAQAAEPPAAAPAAPGLPQMEVVAPKKKPASPPPAAPKATQAPEPPAPAPTAPTLPKIEVIAPKAKAARPSQAAKALPPQPSAPAPPSAVAPAAPAAAVNMSPVAGSALPIDKVPAGISVIGASEIERVGSPSITEAINTYVPGASINEALGNPLATDLQYRGFTASPLNGTPQGLAIYQNGVRMNEVFGDTMNWDLIPQIAVADIVMMSNNPAFGLNALGGSVNLIMKDGFRFQGATVDSRLGSFGHKEVAAEAGQRWGGWATYVAGEWIDENGWRDLSPATAKRAYADIGVKGSGTEFHLNYTFADTFLGVVGPTPVELIDERRANVFTSPQSFDNRMQMVNLTGSVSVTDHLQISGNSYYRGFKQQRPDGNVSEAIACDPAGPNTGLLCFQEADDVLFGRRANGTIVNVPIASLPNGAATVLGGDDKVGVDSFSYGGALQAVSKAPLFDRPNQFLLGASLDLGRARVTSQSQLGALDPRTLAVSGLGIVIDQSLNPDLDAGDVEVTPVDLLVHTHYYGLFFMNTLDVTDRLAVTVGGRYNLANIKLEDQLGEALNGDHTFQRFNPMVGATYKLTPGVTAYAGYSESNRAPTPAELACADPQRPCLLENFLVSDPPLQQVVGRTIEAGLRGQFAAGYAGRDALGAPRSNKLAWSLGYFRTLLSDDILTVASPVQGRGFFINGGDTLRQGVEAAVNYRSDRLFMYASYAFVDATFRDALEIPSPNAPVGVPCSSAVPADSEDEVPNCARVRPGDHIPSIPSHRLKFGFDYWVTPRWRLGGDVIAVSSQFFRGDEGNEDRPLPGYAVVNLRTGYKVTDTVEVYGLVKNLFSKDYATFGTYFDTGALRNVAGDPVGVGRNATVLEDPRTITPAAPLAVYGGVKVKF
jgi:iron complex outermembrane recepter protein